MFKRRSKLKRTFDEKLRSLMNETKNEWEHARFIETHLDDYDQEVFVRRKIAESKHFYLYKEAKARNLGRD